MRRPGSATRAAIIALALVGWTAPSSATASAERPDTPSASRPIKSFAYSPLPDQSSRDAFVPKAHPPVMNRAFKNRQGQLEPQATSGYLYAGTVQYSSSDGGWMDADVARPYLARSDSHTLAELAVESEDGNQIVEVGWTIDRAVNGDVNPHLFVYHWVDGQESCYNGCGFVPSGSIAPGQALTPGKYRFSIQHRGGAWHVRLGTQDIGYFPDSLWGGKFTRAGMIQWFGEVAVGNTSSPCSDMGNGMPGASASAATIDVGYFNGSNVDLSSYETNPSFYSLAFADSHSFRYGGRRRC